MAMTTAQQETVFGTTIDTINAGVRQSRDMSRSGAAMFAMSMLSDAQEMIARGDDENARQTINRAKYVISEMLIDPSSDYGFNRIMAQGQS